MLHELLDNELRFEMQFADRTSKTVISTADRHLHEHILHNDSSIKHRTRTQGTHVNPIELNGANHPIRQHEPREVFQVGQASVPLMGIVGVDTECATAERRKDMSEHTAPF